MHPKRKYIFPQAPRSANVPSTKTGAKKGRPSITGGPPPSPSGGLGSTLKLPEDDQLDHNRYCDSGWAFMLHDETIAPRAAPSSSFFYFLFTPAESSKCSVRAEISSQIGPSVHKELTKDFTHTKSVFLLSFFSFFACLFFLLNNSLIGLVSVYNEFL